MPHALASLAAIVQAALPMVYTTKHSLGTISYLYELDLYNTLSKNVVV